MLASLFFKPFADGPLAGKQAMDEAESEEAVGFYYAMSGWDPKTGLPTIGKLSELGLQEYAGSARAQG